MTSPTLETLDDFYNWFFSPENTTKWALPIFNPLNFNKELTAITLCRKGPFQAELLIGHTQNSYTSTTPPELNRIASFIGGELSARTHKWEGSFAFDQKDELDHYSTHPKYDELSNPHAPSYFPLTPGMTVEFSFSSKGGALILFEKRSQGKHRSCLDSLDLKTLSP